jgi:hypothetical protein
VPLSPNEVEYQGERFPQYLRGLNPGAGFVSGLARGACLPKVPGSTSGTISLLYGYAGAVATTKGSSPAKSTKEECHRNHHDVIHIQFIVYRKGTMHRKGSGQ